MGPWLKVYRDRLEKLGIEPATPGLQGQQFIHYTSEALDTHVLGAQNNCFIGIVFLVPSAKASIEK